MSKGITILVKGLKQTIDGIDTFINKSRTELAQAMNEFAVNTETDAKRLAPVDEGYLRNSISHNVKITDKEIIAEVLVNAEYAAYVEFGTRSFAAKYVASLPADWQTFAAQFKGKAGGTVEEMLMRLTQWVKRKGFAAQLTKSGNASKSKSSIEQQESAAYVIALRILQNGIKPHPYLYPAYDKNIKALEAKLK
jgi:HK97 gp10 family phage protein